LTIRCVEHTSYSQLWMSRLLACCPYIEDLRIDTNASITMDGPWFRPYGATLGIPLAEYRPKPTRLVSLVLVNVRVTHQDLQDLLEVSPQLRDLQVIISVNSERYVFFDCEAFLQYVKTFSSSRGAARQQPLESFHVSIKGKPIDDSEIEERIFGLCPTIGNVTVQLQDFRPVFLDVLQSRSNIITSLEIVNGDGNPSEVLHRYLCVSPHLLHLKAPTTGITVEDMGRPFTSHVDAAAPAGSVLPKIWACRNIRTLQVSFYTRHSFDSPDGGRGDSGAAVCRWIFGYISRVCPQLRHLNIANIESMEFDSKLSYKGKMYPGCMALESGFCLLARLKELKWIRLGTFDADLDVKSADVSWMLLADEMNETRRVERQQVVNAWTFEQGAGSGESQPSGRGVAEHDTLLRHIGTLLDVKTMIDEMNAVENFECWPSLRGITICRQGGCGQDRKHEVDRLVQEAAQSSAPSSVTPAKTSRSPLHLPELLDHTFSFLSDYTITHVIILVCRQWFYVGQHRLVREQVWETKLSQSKQDVLLADMGRVDRLCYYCHGRYDDPFTLKGLWTALGERSRQHRFLDWEQRRLQQRRQPSTSSGYIKPWLTPEEAEDEDTAELPLKELRLQGYMGLSNLTLVLPAMAHLTSLEIQTAHVGILSMLNILESCPLLQRLYIDSGASTGRVLVGPWFSPARINPRDGQKRKRIPLALRSLVLRNVSVPQSGLETLITLTPHLRELVLVVKEFFPDRYPDDDGDAISTRIADAPRRIRELVKLHHSATLCSFFFSPPYSTTAFSTDMIQDWIQDLPAPHANLDWTFEGPELTPPIITHLTTVVPNTITTLHIMGKCPTLHDYLCASPHLLHLMAPNSAIPLDDLDIHFRQTQGYPSPSVALRYQQNQQQQQQFLKVWACQRLTTLHIAFLPHKATASSSRLIFGYISRVCPGLQDLEIHGPEFLTRQDNTWPPPDASFGRLCVRLESGLCLLSELKGLERLVVGTVDHNSFHLVVDDDVYSVEDYDLAVDFDWMVPAGHSTYRRHARQAWFDKEEKTGGGWGKRLEVEEVNEVARRQNYQQFLADHSIDIKLQQGVASEHENTDLARSLEDLGLLRDVKQVLERMERVANDQVEYRCWPHLYRLSIYQENIFGLQPEAEIQRILKADDLKKQEPHASPSRLRLRSRQ
ncbi:hypothetical protein BG015_009582, partial [Linnemannia schmuckeri]